LSPLHTSTQRGDAVFFSRKAESELFRSQPTKIFPKFQHPQSLQHANTAPAPFPARRNRDSQAGRDTPESGQTMISEKQLKANRSNALLSTGPRTEEGRQRASMNALRHGITGQVTTMTDEDRAAHDKLSQALMQDLAPEGAIEIQLAQRIATDSWRLDRISAIEDNLFALGLHEHAGALCPDNEQVDAALTTARVFTREAKNLQLLTLYEQRINRSLQKNLAMLLSLQATRKARREAELKEAASLLKISEMRGLEYDPSKDGFLFSNDQIHAAIDREQRLHRASTTDLGKYRPRKFHTIAA
jgi:hypothetical protein